MPPSEANLSSPEMVSEFKSAISADDRQQVNRLRGQLAMRLAEIENEASMLRDVQADAEIYLTSNSLAKDSIFEELI
jgi:hypothetical protein